MGAQPKPHNLNSMQNRQSDDEDPQIDDDDGV